MFKVTDLMIKIVPDAAGDAAWEICGDTDEEEAMSVGCCTFNSACGDCTLCSGRTDCGDCTGQTCACTEYPCTQGCSQSCGCTHGCSDPGSAHSEIVRKAEALATLKAALRLELVRAEGRQVPGSNISTTSAAAQVWVAPTPAKRVAVGGTESR
jgi:hypothetical protein